MDIITEQFDGSAELYCPHCNRYQEVDDYEFTGVSGVGGILTNASCDCCGGALVVQ
jgi:hypothetical protein